MFGVFSVPVRLLSWMALGIAVGAGWKVGSYLAETAIDEKGRWWASVKDLVQWAQAEEPIWRRKFTKVSEE